jgi:hypothetical protein
LSLRLLTKIHPVVIAIISALFVTSCLILFANVDSNFKMIYRLLCFAMIFFTLVLESYRIDNLEPDWKQKCKDLEKR